MSATDDRLHVRQESSTDQRPEKSNKCAVVIIPPEECWEQIQKIRQIHDKGYVRWMPHINLVYPFIPDNDNGRNFLDASKKIQDALSDVEPFRVRFTKDTFKYFMHRKSCTLWLKPLPEGDDVQPVMSDPDGTPEKDAVDATDVAGPDTEESQAVGGVPYQKSPMSKKQEKKARRRAEKVQQITSQQQQAADEIGSIHQDVLRLQSIIEAQFSGFTDVSEISDRGFTPHLSLGQFPPSTVTTHQQKFSQDWNDIEFDVTEVHLISRADFHDPFHVRYSAKLGIK